MHGDLLQLASTGIVYTQGCPNNVKFLTTLPQSLYNVITGLIQSHKVVETLKFLYGYTFFKIL